MTNNVALTIALVALIALLVIFVALWTTSRRLFRAVITLHPDRRDLARWPIFGQYGPLPPAQMAYLQKRRFNDLQDPALRGLGRRSLRLFYAYAVAFMVLLFSLLWWSVVGGTA